MIAPHTIAARAPVDETQTIEVTRARASRSHLLSHNPKSHISRWRGPVDGAREAWTVRPGGLEGCEEDWMVHLFYCVVN